MTTLQSVAGQLPVAKTALYTCPANTRAIVKSWTVVNVHSTNHRFRLFAKKWSVSSSNIVDFDIDEQDKADSDKETILEAGESIEGQCPDGATYMDYVLNIAEITDLLTA